jgi:hypothetical protein
VENEKQDSKLPYGPSKLEVKAYKTFISCLLAAIFGAFTIWSINGTYIGAEDHIVNDHYTNIYTVDPLITGILAFVTIILTFISIYEIISYLLDKPRNKD